MYIDKSNGKLYSNLIIKFEPKYKLIGGLPIGGLPTMTWHDFFYIIESPYRNIEAWHDSNTLQAHPRINIKVQYMKYMDEYIPKLQLHQHGYHFKGQI